MKKCKICETELNDINKLDYITLYEQIYCVECKTISNLKTELIKYSKKIRDIQDNDPIQNNNMITEFESTTEFGHLSIAHLDTYDEKIIIKNRTNRIKDLINRIIAGRNFLYRELEPKVQILRSIYKNKDRFWNDSENMKFHICIVIIEYIVIKLNEFLSKSKNATKYSIHKIENIIKENKYTIYNAQKIIIEKKYHKSGDVQYFEYPRFEIESYLENLETFREEYRNIINAIDDYRDNMFAHMDDLKNTDSKIYLTYNYIIKIFNSLKIIYDGFLYSVAPDKYTNLHIEFNLKFDLLNKISQFYSDNY